MTALLAFCSRSALWFDRMAPLVLPTLARFVFAAVLLVYFWGSALTKLGDGPLGLFRPSSGAYVQIFPKAMEAVGYDTSALGLWHWAVVVAGTSAEFLLPALLLIGLCTRLAALGMLGFIAVQTLTDLYGHGAIHQAATVGAWFDRASGSLILDQRAFWVVGLMALVMLGGGPLSADRALRNAPWARPAFPQR
ncbi:MAG: DoxX family membrane protein [Rhodobacteraceae bacterium]|nr:DoxX family membrane protein [Paracoccaceae bacterium]